MANLCGPQAEKHVEIHEEISKDGKTCEKKIFFTCHNPRVSCVSCQGSLSVSENYASVSSSTCQKQEIAARVVLLGKQNSLTLSQVSGRATRERERGLTWDETNGKVVESHCSRYHTHHSHYTVALPYQLAIATGTANLAGRC